MSELFNVEITDSAPRQIQLRLTVVSAEVRRLWNTKSFGLCLLLEPIFLGHVAPPPALLDVLTRAEIEAWQIPLLRLRASKVITSVGIESVIPSLSDHIKALDALDASEINAYFAASNRAPRALFRIRLKGDGMAAHLTTGLRWRSAACDLG